MLSYFANPEKFYGLSRVLKPVFLAGFILLLALGWGFGLNAPLDEEQGSAAKLMFVHVPAAWACMFAYAALATASLFSFIWRHVVADAAAKAIAPLGMVLTGLALATGSIWGKPMWGSWWEWDARLTSVLILFFMFWGYMLLRSAIENAHLEARLSAILAMIGAINLPIIHYSVDWWNSLHQPASVLKTGGSSMSPEFLWPLLASGLAYLFLFLWLTLINTETELKVMKEKTQNAQRQPSTLKPKEEG